MLQVLLAIMFAMAELVKVFGESAMVEMFAAIGLDFLIAGATFTNVFVLGVGPLLPLVLLLVSALVAGGVLQRIGFLARESLMPNRLQQPVSRPAVPLS